MYFVLIGHGRPRPLVLGDISQLIVATERPRFESRSGLPFWNGSSSLGLGFLNPTSQLKRTNVKGFCTQLVIKWASYKLFLSNRRIFWCRHEAQLSTRTLNQFSTRSEQWNQTCGFLYTLEKYLNVFPTKPPRLDK